MNQEKELSKVQLDNKMGLSIIADCFYLSHFVSTAMLYPIRKMIHSPLKLFALDYQQNQERWVGRFRVAGKQYEKEYGDKINSMLKSDVSKDDLEIYYGILSSLKDANHMEVVATVIDHMNKLGDKLPELAPKLIMWLKNEIELNK